MSKAYETGWKPEPQLKDTAFDMLRILFDSTATNDERAMAASTLAEAVLPDMLDKSWRYDELRD